MLSSQRSRLALLATAVLLLGTQQAPRLSAQQAAKQEPSSSKEETFKVQANSVTVDMIVTDHKGHHVPGLTASDFTILEDNVPQKIVSFSPPEGSATAGVAPAASANGVATTVTTKTSEEKPATPASTPARQHFLTVVLDLADNRPANVTRSCEAVLHYLDKAVSANDFVAIYYIDRTLHLALPFTNDLTQARTTLTRLETRLTSGGFTGADRNSMQQEINDLFATARPGSQLGVAAEPQTGTPGRGTISSEAGTNMILEREIQTMQSFLSVQNTIQAKAVFVALRAISLSYRDMPGRKNVVLFSEGFLYSDDAKPQLDAVADAANRANVAIYVIDPVGLEMGTGSVTGRGSSTINSQMLSVALEGAGAPGSHSQGNSKFDKMRSLGETSRNDQLETLADNTGGFLVKNTNDLLPAFTKVLDDSRDFYTLVYQPTNKNFDGKFRKIKVEFQQKGYQLRYRQGYWAIPRGQAVAMTPSAAQLLASVQSGSVKPSFKTEVHADLLLSPDGHYAAPVTVLLHGSQVPLEKVKDADGFKGALTLVLVARNPKGDIVSIRQRDWHFLLNHKEEEDFKKSYLPLQTQIQVPDLQHLVIQAIVQPLAGLVGMGSADVPIGASEGEGPRLTSLLLSSKVEPATCSDPADALCILNVRLFQPPQPQFTSSGRLNVYFAASDLQLDPQTKQPRVSVAFTLKSRGNVEKSPAAENLQAIPGPSPGSVLVFAEFNLNSMHVGSYTLDAVTQDLVRHTSTTQQALFQVR